jgi:hypothetical protein
MTLEEACELLAEVHTRDDEGTGFTVVSGAVPDGAVQQSSYYLAWSVIRVHAKLQVKSTAVSVSRWIPGWGSVVAAGDWL